MPKSIDYPMFNRLIEFIFAKLSAVYLQREQARLDNIQFIGVADYHFQAAQDIKTVARKNISVQIRKELFHSFINNLPDSVCKAVEASLNSNYQKFKKGYKSTSIQFVPSNQALIAGRLLQEDELAYTEFFEEFSQPLIHAVVSMSDSFANRITASQVNTSILGQAVASAVYPGYGYTDNYLYAFLCSIFLLAPLVLLGLLGYLALSSGSILAGGISFLVLGSCCCCCVNSHVDASVRNAPLEGVNKLIVRTAFGGDIKKEAQRADFLTQYGSEMSKVYQTLIQTTLGGDASLYSALVRVVMEYVYGNVKLAHLDLCWTLSRSIELASKPAQDVNEDDKSSDEDDSDDEDKKYPFGKAKTYYQRTDSDSQITHTVGLNFNKSGKSNNTIGLTLSTDSKTKKNQ